jgi:hypothetical protein
MSRTMKMGFVGLAMTFCAIICFGSADVDAAPNPNQDPHPVPACIANHSPCRTSVGGCCPTLVCCPLGTHGAGVCESPDFCD